MSEIEYKNIHVSTLEKLIINFAIPSDFVHWVIRSKITNEYADQSLKQRLIGIWSGKIMKYQKLLSIKEKYKGKIPKKVRTICKQTTCGSVRLWMAENYRKKI